MMNTTTTSEIKVSGEKPLAKLTQRKREVDGRLRKQRNNQAEEEEDLGND